MPHAEITKKMIDFYNGNVHDTNHFLKVYGFAKTIGELEALPEKTQTILEISAIVHDIACPACREKYGNTNGSHQEAESPVLLKEFLAEFHLPKDIEDRVIYLVSHHHTYTGVDGPDYQILLEADFLVNAFERPANTQAIQGMEKQVFKTKSGLHLLHSMYPEAFRNKETP